MQLCGGVRMFWIADTTFGLRLMSLVCGGLFAETLIKTEAKHVRDMPHPPISGRSDFNSPAALTAKDTVLSSNILEAVVLAKRQESAIVSKHNDLRNQVQPTAKKMRKITWNKELSDVATNYSRKCIYEHNKDRRHSRFGQIGENIYIVKNRIWSERLAKWAITVWDLEKNEYDYETRKCTPGKKCGHYTQTAWDDTFKVGCGATRCRSVAVGRDTWEDAVLFVCNYGPTGNYDRRPFIAGQSCSDCDEGDVCEGNLCSNQIRDIDFDVVKRQWNEWSSWTACLNPCYGGNATRRRTCNTFVSMDCPYDAVEVGFKCVGPHCRSQPATGNIEGNFGPWSNWGGCSSSCGDGIITRTRECPSNVCDGLALATKGCSIRACPGKPQWSVWSEWSACSAACGDGKRTRTRRCRFGRSCAGYYSEEKQCDGNCMKPTAGKPQWSVWSEWSACSAACGDGKRTRTRSCRFGRSCAGNSTNPTKQAAGSRGNFLKPSISLTSAVAAAMMIFYDFI